MNKTFEINKKKFDNISNILFDLIKDKIKDDADFINKKDIITYENGKYLKFSRFEESKEFFKNKIIDKSNNLTDGSYLVSLSVSKLKASNGVSSLKIDCSIKNNSRTILLIDNEIYVFNESEIHLELIEFSKKNNFNLEQECFLQEYLNESIPNSINLDNFIYMFEESIENSLDLQSLSELLEPTIESINEENYSKDIFSILINEDNYLNLFKDKLIIEKSSDGYNIYFTNILIKSIKYKVLFT